MSTDHGDIILDGLIRTVGGLLIVALLLFEAGAVMVSHVRLDGVAQEAAGAAAHAWDVERSESAVAVAVEEASATLDGAWVRDIAVGREAVSVTLSRSAPVLLVDHIGAVARWLVTDVTARAPVR